jgi:hypothetical protein
MTSSLYDKYDNLTDDEKGIYELILIMSQPS